MQQRHNPIEKSKSRNIKTCLSMLKLDSPVGENNKELSTYSARMEVNKLSGKLKGLEMAHGSFGTEVDKLREKIQELEMARGTFGTEVDKLREKIKGLEMAHGSFGMEVDELGENIQELEMARGTFGSEGEEGVHKLFVTDKEGLEAETKRVLAQLNGLEFTILDVIINSGGNGEANDLENKKRVKSANELKKHLQTNFNKLKKHLQTNFTKLNENYKSILAEYNDSLIKLATELAHQKISDDKRRSQYYSLTYYGSEPLVKGLGSSCKEIAVNFKGYYKLYSEIMMNDFKSKSKNIQLSNPNGIDELRDIGETTVKALQQMSSLIDETLECIANVCLKILNFTDAEIETHRTVHNCNFGVERNASDSSDEEDEPPLQDIFYTVNVEVLETKEDNWILNSDNFRDIRSSYNYK